MLGLKCKKEEKIKNALNNKINPNNLVHKDPGLGNLLFEISMLTSTAKKYNLKYNTWYINIHLNRLNKLFNYSYKKNIFRNIKGFNSNFKPDMRLKEKHNQIYDEKLIKTVITNKNKNILLYGNNFQSIKYFNEYEKDIQKMFEPDSTSLKYILKKYPIFNDNKIIKISIHLRCEWFKKDLIILKKDFYLQAINYIKKNINNDNIILIVVSDNINKAKMLFKNVNENFIYCEKNLDYIDLWTSSLCHHNIIGHSTFGWWGAYLNKNHNKIVAYPNDIFTHFFKKILKKNDNDIKKIKANLYPTSWICMDTVSMY